MHEGGNDGNFIGLLILKQLLQYDPAKPQEGFRLPVIVAARGKREYQLLPGARLLPNGPRSPASDIEDAR